MRFLDLSRALAVLVCLSAGAVLAQQTSPDPADAPASQPPVTFKVEIDYVEVDAVVTDDQDNFIRDLQMSDFQVLEDGVPQEVTVFSLVDIPIERDDRPLFAEQPIEPDVRSNRQPFDGRLYVILLDDLHTSTLRSAQAKQAAQRFIERHLGSNDLAAVLFTSGRLDGAQDFTSSRRLLAAAVDRFVGRKLRSATLERMDRYQVLRDTPRGVDDGIDDPRDGERGQDARSTLGTLKNVADWLNGIRGRRKAVLFVSEGIDYDVYDDFNSRYATVIRDDVRDTIAAATQSNMNVYTIDPAGLGRVSSVESGIQAFPDESNLNVGLADLQRSQRFAQDSLRVLADETGGFATVNTNDVTQALDRIVRESSTYYVLGYYPTNTERDGRVRRVDVRVSRSNAQVRARQTYVAPSAGSSRVEAAEAATDPSTALREALDSPLPVPGLPMAAAAAAFKGEAPRASVVVVMEVDGSGLTFTEREGIYHDRLEVVVLPIDRKGEVDTENIERMAADMKLKPQTHEAVSRNGVRLMSRLELSPGRYQLRIGAREDGDGATGTLYYDLDVPDFSGEALVMSGLLMTSVRATQIPTMRQDAELKELLPGPPTTAREFSPSDTLALFTEIYDNRASAPHSVEIRTMLRGDDGSLVFSDSQERSTKELQAARGGFGHTAQIPLSGVQPGRYVLKVEARSTLSGSSPVAREILIRIR